MGGGGGGDEGGGGGGGGVDGGSGMSSTWTCSLSAPPWFPVRLAPKRRSTGGVGL